MLHGCWCLLEAPPFAVVCNVSEGALGLQNLRREETATLLEDLSGQPTVQEILAAASGGQDGKDQKEVEMFFDLKNLFDVTQKLIYSRLVWSDVSFLYSYPPKWYLYLRPLNFVQDTDAKDDEANG